MHFHFINLSFDAKYSVYLGFLVVFGRGGGWRGIPGNPVSSYGSEEDFWISFLFELQFPQ